MKAEDQFHVGIVVDDFEATLAHLSELFGYLWCDEMALPTPVTLPTGDAVLDLRFTYSRNAPRLEIVQSIAGTLWVPAVGSGIHHVGFWSDDVARDSADLEQRGVVREAAGTRPDGTPFWAYHRSASGPRIELVSREVQPALEQYWAASRKRD